ncbi:exported hypothetical protein [metagenome]|uniref:Lipoprotein n=1 Tax=metagenome TaxID=256318 RepID=A0A2P2CJR1_9ZZZZ
MPIRRPVHAGVLALTAVLASGCGGVDSSGAPKTATEVDFCMTWVKQGTDAQAFLERKIRDRAMPTAEEIASLSNDWIAEMVAVGTPSDMPDEARAWFEAALDEEVDADDVDPADYEDYDPASEWDELSGEEFTQARALNTYIQDTCTALWRERGLL